MNSTSFNIEENCTYGIDVINDILQFSAQNQCFDMRTMRILLSQKTLLLDRYKYLTSNKDTKTIDELSNNKQLMQLAFTHSMKYNYTKSKHNFDIVYNYLNEITQKEKILLPNYLSFV